MHRVSRVLISVIFVWSFAGAAGAQKVDTERQKEILELLTVINADQLFQQIANATAQSTMRSMNARKGKKLSEKQMQVPGIDRADQGAIQYPERHRRALTFEAWPLIDL